MRYTWKKSWSVLLMLLVLLITIGCASEQKPDSGEMPTGFHEDYNENDILNDPDEPDNWISEDDLDAIKEAQEELRENFEGKYYTYDTMTPERQAYRLSCIREGINLSTNGGVGAFDQRYNDAMRNVYSLNGQDAVMSGTVIYVDRQGMYTSLLIQKPYQNIIVAGYAEGDIPVIQNDEITIFGRCDGPTTYTNTNEYGVSTEHPTFGVEIRDYYMGGPDPILDYKLNYPFEEFPIEHFEIDRLVEGMPPLTGEEAAYWYGTYKSGIALSQDAIDVDGEVHPYTAYSYSYDDATGAYVIRFRYTEIADLYPENSYSYLCLSYNSLSITTDERTKAYLYDALQNAGLFDNYYTLEASCSDNYVGDIQR